MWRYLSDGLDLFSKKGMCAQIVFGVERGGKFFGFDGFAAAGGVDEFAVADVEADMGIFVCAAGIEKDKIAGFQFAVGNFSAGCGHIARGAWQIDVEGVFIDELDHAAAVKACGCGTAAPFVGRADQAHAVKHQFLRTLCAVNMGNADRLDFSGGYLRLVGFVFAGGAAGGQQ